ncbi:MAG: methyltransferase [Gemmatimonas sp. SG8_17]|nr:MAG: methyltransferase [Gemmatimonas sp. SG8_17]
MNDGPLRLPSDAFSRLDEEDDTVFYARDRFVEHLDSRALQTVGDLIGALVVEERPVILDLMASWDSHIPQQVRPGRVIGIGLNENELRENQALDEYVLHDLNRVPGVPFADGTIDAVICTVSVDYMTRPVEVFREMGRILKPGGLFLVTFSNRYFPPKVVKIWECSSEEERVHLVQHYFKDAQLFDEPRVFVSKGRLRPNGDKYTHLGIPSDPVYAVYADKVGGHRIRPEPLAVQQVGPLFNAAEIETRRQRVEKTLRCPYCDERLSKWEVPQTPFTEWPSEHQYICFNDDCSYFVAGWETMKAQGGLGSYRFMYEPTLGNCYPVPVLSRDNLREGIIEDE